ncbi:MAG: glycosyltransferase [Candidatus Woesearchaeota archaeon]
MFSIILPTYNERESILTTIKNIKKAIKSKEKYEIIVVDDDSPDKTWELVDKTFKNNDLIYCIRRKNKKGLSSAIIDGFIKAKGEYVFVTDADGQHDETKFDLMFEKIKTNDLVIGTRFRKGGSVAGWSKYRIFVSRFAAMLARPFLSKQITDPMSGFFGIKKSVFMKYKSKLDGRGYKILLDILFQNKNFKTAEVAYHFKTRQAGESKLSTKVIIDYLLMLFKHAIKTNLHFIPFAIVGVSGIFVNLFILYLGTLANLFPELASFLGVAVSIQTNFLLNNIWTWSHVKKKYSFISRLFKFNITSIVALIITVSVFSLLTRLFMINPLISQVIGIALSFPINYFINDRWTFNEK